MIRKCVEHDVVSMLTFYKMNIQKALDQEERIWFKANPKIILKATLCNLIGKKIYAPKREKGVYCYRVLEYLQLD